MSWVRLSSVSVANNSNIVAINAGNTADVKVGDALLIDGFDLVEVEGVFANQLQLRKPWAHAAQSSAQAVVVPTFGDFNIAVKEVRKLKNDHANNYAQMESFWTELGEVTFHAADGSSFTFKTARQTADDLLDIEQRASLALMTATGLISQYDEDLGDAYRRVLDAQNAASGSAQSASRDASSAAGAAAEARSSEQKVLDALSSVENPMSRDKNLSDVSDLSAAQDNIGLTDALAISVSTTRFLLKSHPII